MHIIVHFWIVVFAEAGHKSNERYTLGQRDFYSTIIKTDKIKNEKIVKIHINRKIKDG